MTLEAQTPRGIHTGSGTTGPFTLQDDDGVQIQVDSASHVILTKYASANATSGTVLTHGVDYTLAGVPSNGVTYTLTAALASGEFIEWKRIQPLNQNLDLDHGGDFSATNIEARFDTNEQQIQENRSSIDRALKAHWKDTSAPSLPATPTEDKLLARNSSGDIVYKDTTTISDSVVLASGWSDILGDAPPASLDDLGGVRSKATYAELTAMSSGELTDGCQVNTLARTTFGDGGAGVWRYKVYTSGAPTADGGTVLAHDTIANAYFERIFSGPVDASWFGYTGDGTTDDRAAIQSAIDYWGPFDDTSPDGGEVVIPAKDPDNVTVALLGASLVPRHGVNVRGSGRGAVELKANGDFPVFEDTSTVSEPLNKFRLSNITIRGGGKANTDAHGVKIGAGNNCEIEDVNFFSCRNALDLSHQWQTNLNGIYIHGGGSDQNYNGVVMQQSTLVNIDNAVYANGVHAKGCENVGFRIINGQGSKFESCEAGANDIGWYIGDPSSGTVLCQWLHLNNCLSDSSTQQNWKIVKGSATELSEMIITDTWSGNSGDEGILIEGAIDINLAGVISITTDKEAVKLDTCTRVLVANVTTRQYNSGNHSLPAITVEDSEYCAVQTVVGTSTNGGESVKEVGTSDNNQFGNLFNQPTLISGNNTSVSNAAGTYNALFRSSGSSSIGIVGAAGSSAYLGLGTDANPLLHNIERTSGSELSFKTNGGQRFVVGNGSGESGFVNTSNVPFAVYSVAVASLPGWGSSSAGRVAYATDGRKAGEGVGSGTGVLVFHDGSNWIACDTGATVAA